MQLLIIANIVLAVIMIGVILIQQDKSGGAGAALSGGANSMFGGGGSASFLAKVTGGLALLFFLNSMVIAYVANNASGTSIDLGPVSGLEVDASADDLPAAADNVSDIPSAASDSDIPTE